MEAISRSNIIMSEEEWNDDSSSSSRVVTTISSGVCSDDFMTTQLLNNDDSCPAARSNFTCYWQLGHDSTLFFDDNSSTNNYYDPAYINHPSSSLLYSDFSHDHQNIISAYHESYNNPNYYNDDGLMLAANNVLEGGDHDYTNQDFSNDSTHRHSKEDRAVLSNNPAPTKKRARINEQDQQFHISQKRSGKLKKGSEDDEDDDRNNKKNIVFHRQNSSCSENEFNESQEFNGSSSPKGKTSVNLNGKKRANRGSATDPQSLYARKRRERINERLRTLQTLIPNGTKVDISTMLEEAVHYVKFLQLQIKLLSSDEQWMYAPIAYNGMDIGLDHVKISTP